MLTRFQSSSLCSYRKEYITNYLHGNRSQWPRGLRCVSAAARLLRFRLRMPPGAWVSFSSKVKKIPTQCGVTECDLETSKMRGPRPNWALEPRQKLHTKSP